jgi:hypothetical protein
MNNGFRRHDACLGHQIATPQLLGLRKPLGQGTFRLRPARPGAKRNALSRARRQGMTAVFRSEESVPVG